MNSFERVLLYAALAFSTGTFSFVWLLIHKVGRHERMLRVVHNMLKKEPKND